MTHFLAIALATVLASSITSEPQPVVGMLGYNLACGIPPLPPLGCRVGRCICDQNGQNCQWEFIC